MSLTKSTAAHRRLSLMTGASLVAASLSAALSFGAAALAPGVARAENECTPVAPTGPDPADNGVLADTYACAGSATYSTTGITYESVGDLRVNSTGAMSVGAVGVNLTDGLVGNPVIGADDLTFTATGTITGTGGAAIDVRSEAGDIVISTAGVTASSGTSTHAIRAISDAGGAVSVTVTGSGVINANSTSLVTGDSAIEARSTGGAGAVTVTTGTGSVTGRLRGIYAQSSGTGALTINTNGSVTNNTSVQNGGVGQISAIDAVSGSGLMTININGTVTGTAGNAIRAVAGGDIAVNVAASRAVTANMGAEPLSDWVMDLAAGADGTITLTNEGTIRPNMTSAVATPERNWREMSIRASGGSLLIDNLREIHGRVDFSGIADGVVFNNGGAVGARLGWRTTGASVFSPGADALNVASGRYIFVGGYTSSLDGDLPSSWDFSDGDDTISLADEAMMFIGSTGSTLGTNPAQGRLTITNLETFNNAGTIVLGGRQTTLTTAANVETDDLTDDRLAMEGTTFNGLGDSRIALDANFQGVGQDTCEAAVLADCLYLAGGVTTGTTVLKISDASSVTEFGGYLGSGIVLIDVSGGASAAEHFTVDPNSDYYIADGPHAGMMERGYFLFALGFDAEKVQHKLISVPGPQLMAFTAIPQAVQSIWHTSTALSFDRQAQVRDTEPGPGVWLRAGVESSDRDFVQTFTHAFGAAATYDNSYSQQTNTLTGGVDLAGEVWGGAYLIGAMLGYVRSELEFDGAVTNATYEGGSLGLYGGYGLGPFRFDAAVNGLLLAADLEDPAVDLPTGLVNREMMRAIGARAEAGYRFGFGQLFVEPLVAASWVRGRFDQLVLQQAKVDYDDPTSARLGAGLRLGGDVPLEGIVLRLDVTGRVWEEFEGENTAIVDNDADDLPLIDDFSGTFSELTAGVSASLPSGLGIFANAGGKFNDGYQAVNGAVGVTFRW